MRFLKVNLFRTYSLNEQVSQKISLALSRYKKHLSVYKDKIDKNLFNFYNETDRFHDYQIVELSYKFDSCNKKSKILLLKIRSYDNDKEFEIHFSEKFSSKIKYNSYFLRNQIVPHSHHHHPILIDLVYMVLYLQ